MCLRHIGDVTVVLSKRGRNVGPKHTKILVTNLDEWTPRQVVCAYQRRWPVEQINRELKTDLGLGEHQVKWRGRTNRALLWHCRDGVLVADPCVSSGHPPWQAVECGSASACIALTSDHQSGGAQCEDTTDKRSQSSLIACFRPMRCHF